MQTCGNRHNDYPDFFAERIVGGVEANPGEFPWQVSIQVIRYRSTEDDESLTEDDIRMDEKRRFGIKPESVIRRLYVDMFPGITFAGAPSWTDSTC